MGKFVIAALLLVGPFSGLAGCGPSRARARVVTNRAGGNGGHKVHSDGEEGDVGGHEERGKRGNAKAPAAEEEKLDTARKERAGLRAIPRISTVPEEDGSTGLVAKKTEVRPEAPGENEGFGAKQLVVDDFRQGLRWKPVSWTNANDCELGIIEQEGYKALKLDCKAGKEEKAAIKLEWGGRLDITGFNYTRLVVDSGAVGEDEDVKFAVAFQTDAYYESEPSLAEVNSDEVFFPLKSSNYKTTPDWTYSAKVRGRGQVRAIYLLVYYDETAEVVIKKIEFIRQKESGVEKGDTSAGGGNKEREAVAEEKN